MKLNLCDSPGYMSSCTDFEAILHEKNTYIIVHIRSQASLPNYWLSFAWGTRITLSPGILVRPFQSSFPDQVPHLLFCLIRLYDRFACRLVLNPYALFISQ